MQLLRAILAVPCCVALFAQTNPGPPKHYSARHTSGSIRIDGRLNEADWKLAPWSDDFVDIEGSARPLPRFRTRMKML